jgi:polar amino acid transport system substrate-binding protein
MKILIFLFAILFFSCKSESNVVYNSWNEIKKRGKIIIGIDEFFPPMTFKGGEKFEGIDVDLANETFSRLGVKTEFVPVVWKDIIHKLTNREIDIIWSGLSITEERKKVIDFSIPYIQTRQVIVVPFDSDINTKEDLKGKIVGVQKGTSSERILREDNIFKSPTRILFYKDVNSELKAIEEGKISAIIIDEIVAKYFLSKYHKKFKVIQTDLGVELFAVGIRKEDKKLKEKVDTTLTKLMKNGTEARIFKKWIGETQLFSDYLKRLKEVR